MITTREATPADLQSIVEIHKAAFEGFFLTALGPRFLLEMYRAFICEQGAICRVIETDVGLDNVRVAGFVAGALRPELFFRHLLLSRGARFALAAVPGFLRNPLRTLPRLLSAVFYRGEMPPAVEGAALLSSLAVYPSAAGAGLGRTLVEGFCENAAGLGARAVYLSTDRLKNEATNRFYERAGFQLMLTRERRDGRIMNMYVRNLMHGSSS